MRSLLVGILLASAAVSPALAQDNGDHRHHDQQQNGRTGDRAQRQQQAQPQQQPRAERFNGGNAYRQQRMPQFASPQQQQQVQMQQAQRQGWNRERFEGRSGVQVQGEAPQQVRNGGWYGQRVQPQYRGANQYAGRGWNRNWRDDSRYDWRRYRDSHRSVFHVGVYLDPFGYAYQPFSIGYRLPPVYFGQQYWIDPRMYDLPYPPPGTQWVRYWNDALLVDMYSGEIVDVIQGFFW